MTKDFFAWCRRGGLSPTVSVAKLTTMMVDVLSQLPAGTPPSKEVVVRCLGLVGQMCRTRDINTAWSQAKRRAARDLPDKLWLDGKVLRSAADTGDRPREKLSAAGHRKLCTLAAKEDVTPDELLGRLIAAWRNQTTASE